MWFSEADASALGRCLAQVADSDSDLIDLFLERKRDFELRPEEPGPGVVERSDLGFAVRLVREGRTYLSARDGVETGALESALREIARLAPSLPYRVPELLPAPLAAFDHDTVHRRCAELSRDVRRLVRERHAACEFRMRCALHQRSIQLVGPRLVPGAETEEFFHFEVSSPWGRFGALGPDLDDRTAGALAGRLVDRLRARDREAVSSFSGPIVLAPAATAVLLHEAVAHALEADTLVLTGHPEAAVGVSLGSPLLDVIDSPSDLPVGLSRETDDEGMPVSRRWLLRRGTVVQPLADRFHAGSSSHLSPGAARRSSRHLPPVPRSTHLELVSGSTDPEELFQGSSGIYFSEISRGRLDSLSGELTVEFPFGRQFVSGELKDWVGRCVLRGQASEILGAVEAVACNAEFAGAGWCAKGGQLLPVWATCPAIRLDGVRLTR